MNTIYRCDIDKCKNKFTKETHPHLWDRKSNSGFPLYCDKHHYKNYSCHDEEWNIDRWHCKAFKIPNTVKCCDGSNCAYVLLKKERARLSSFLSRNYSTKGW